MTHPALRNRDAAPEEGRFVGRYEIVHEIGRGGMSVVYLARQADLERDVALKELASFHATDPAFVERFLRESRMSGSLSHPNIVAVHDYFEHDDRPYIAMEYLERGSLRPYVGKLGLAQIAGVLEGLLAGLEHAAHRGIVHRDLKPENVLLADDGGVKIGDFGIAKALNHLGGASLTQTGMAIGSPVYMAPEQATAGEVGPWTDLYSAGVLAYELIVGRVPFPEGDSPFALLWQHVHDPLPSPLELRPDLDPRIAAWLERMLAKEPSRRPENAEQAWDELEETVLALLGPRWRRSAASVQKDEPARSPTPVPIARPPEPIEPVPPSLRETVPPVTEPPAPPAPPRVIRMWRGRAMVGGAVLMAALFVVLFLIVRDRGPAPPPPPPPVEIPLVAGESEARAIERLERLGLRVPSDQIRRGTHPTAAAGTVVAQDPAPGTRVSRGRAVTIVVSTGRPRTTVPAVKGSGLVRARAALRGAHLRWRIVRVHSSRAVGKVLSQAPLPGASVERRSRVLIHVSKGPAPVAVPSVVGLGLDAARAALHAARLRDSVTYVTSPQPRGIVVGQDPGPRARRPPGTTVGLVVSMGPPQVVSRTGPQERRAKRKDPVIVVK